MAAAAAAMVPTPQAKEVDLSAWLFESGLLDDTGFGAVIDGNLTWQSFFYGCLGDTAASFAQQLHLDPNSQAFVELRSRVQAYRDQQLKFEYITTVAGEKRPENLSDEPYTQGFIPKPLHGLEIAQGRMLVVCEASYCVYQVEHDRKIGILAGNIRESGQVDGPFLRARFSSPRFIFHHASRNRYYIAENGRIRALDLTRKEVSTLLNLPVGLSELNDVTSIACGANDDQIFVSTPSAIFMMSFSVSSAAPAVVRLTGQSLGYRDGGLNTAQFNGIAGLAFDPNDNTLLISDSRNNCIRLIRNLDKRPNVAVETIGKAGQHADRRLDGSEAKATFKSPRGILLYKGHLCVADWGYEALRMVTRSPNSNRAYVWTAVSSTNLASSLKDGPVGIAGLSSPTGLSVSFDSTAIYFADSHRNQIRALTAHRSAYILRPDLVTPPLNDFSNDQITNNPTPQLAKLAVPLEPVTDSAYLIKFHELTINEELGKGYFGVVHAGKWKGCDVAIKRQIDRDPESLKKFFAECHTLHQIRPHPHVIPLLGCCQEGDTVYAVFPRMGKDMAKLIHEPTWNRNPDKIIRYASQIASGLWHLSDCTPSPFAAIAQSDPETVKVVHRDIAARNILFEQGSGLLRIADFGMARFLPEDKSYTRSHLEVEPLRWMAPETRSSEIADRKFSHSSDVWAFGCVLVEMITCKEPYPEYTNRQLIEQVLLNPNLRPSIPRFPRLTSLMEACFQITPLDRPTFKQISNFLDSTSDNFSKWIQQ